MAALIKAASDDLPAGQMVFLRSLFAIPVIGVWLWQTGHLHDGLIPSNVMAHVWRGLFGTSAMALTFAGLALLPLPEVTAIGYATPMFTVIFAAFLLGERVRACRLAVGTPGPRRWVLCLCWALRSCARWYKSTCAGWCRPTAPLQLCSTFP
jgi:drug/metabolite transporter (DMT)-like permease